MNTQTNSKISKKVKITSKSTTTLQICQNW